jgi:hypothetical protein
MKAIAIALASLISHQICSAQDRILPETHSPNKVISIVERKTPSGVDYIFYDQKLKAVMGDVLPSFLHDATVNSVTSSWSPDSEKVAVLISYGTKLNGVFLYRIEGATMRLINFPEIDPVSIYEKATRKKFPEDTPGYSENQIGPWLDANAVRIVLADAKEFETGTLHFVVIAELRLAGTKAKINRLNRVGILSDEESARFFSTWMRNDIRRQR